MTFQLTFFGFCSLNDMETNKLCKFNGFYNKNEACEYEMNFIWLATTTQKQLIKHKTWEKIAINFQSLTSNWIITIQCNLTSK